jgi:hypothetical protein
MRPLIIPLYCSTDDVPVLLDILGDDLAFIESIGENQWRATRDRPLAPEFRVALWHVPSGALSVDSGERKAVYASVDDPWSGWTERRHPDHRGQTMHFDYPETPGDILRPGIDVPPPRFNPTPTGIFWLDLKVAGREADSSCAVSQLSWVGNTQAMIGNPAPDVTVKRWAKLKRQIAKVAQKVPRGGVGAVGPDEMWAFPAARQVARCDINPTLH